MKSRKTIMVTDNRDRDRVMQIARETYYKITSKLSNYEIAIYFKLMDATHVGTSRTKIAKDLKMSRPRVSEGLLKLQKVGAIKIDRHGDIELLGA